MTRLATRPRRDPGSSTWWDWAANVITQPLAGLFSLAFPDTTDYGATYGLGGAITGTRSQGYDFDAGDTFSATVTITASDRATNVITQPLAVIRDTTPPTLTVHAPDVAPLHFQVTWSGEDSESGPRATTTWPTRWVAETG
jgi:hypothetical protein